MSDTLLAYRIDDESEGSCIVFAKTNAHARRLGANELSCEWDSVSARRFPAYDAYAPGPVPQMVLLDDGWWFECSSCSTRITSDREDFDGNPIEPVEIHGCLYCTQGCHDRDILDRQERRDVEAAAIDVYRSDLETRLPGVTFVDGHAYASRLRNGDLEIQQVHIYFRFPGCTVGDASYRLDLQSGPAPMLMICNGDVPAWDAWRESVKP